MTTYVTPPCIVCHESSVMDLDEQQVKLWKEGELIQRAFPDLSADECELIKTGTHSDCWDILFRFDQMFEEWAEEGYGE